MTKDKSKQYIYIAQSSNATTRCKIGMTGNLDARLKEYNRKKTAVPVDMLGTYRYLFTCEVQDMRQVENDIKEEFSILREVDDREVYFFNKKLFVKYVEFIKARPLFIEEIFYKKDTQQEPKIQYSRKTSPPLKEQGYTPKDVMQQAKKVADDEFYTRYEDIEKEIAMYDKSIWKDKCVFCNCDDAVDNDKRRTSAFALYFLNNFKELKLKKLICTHYASKIDLFRQGANGYIFTKDGFSEIKDDYDKMKVFPEGYNGSFDHLLSVKILKEEADIVCTNPPFSRSREYWNLLIGSGKKFLILSNFAIILNESYIKHLYNNEARPGYNRVDWFETPKRKLTDAPAHWYTNFPIKDRPRYKNIKIMKLKDIPDKNKRFDDKKVLLVDNCYIPSNYKKPFAISVNPILNGLLDKGYKIVQEKRYTPYIDGKEKFARVLVQKV